MGKHYALCGQCGENFEVDEVEYTFAKKFGIRLLCHNCEGTTDWSLFDKELQRILVPMKDKLLAKHDIKGESWKDVPIDNLRNRLSFKYSLFAESFGKESEVETLVDLANYCMLLYIRLREE